jgi:hypothetical protein
VQKQMKVLWTLNMQVLVLWTFFISFFISYLLFYFEQVATESKWRIYVPSFDVKEKINFRIVQLKSTAVKCKYGSHDQHFTSCKSHTLLLIEPSTTHYSTL